MWIPARGSFLVIWVYY